MSFYYIKVAKEPEKLPGYGFRKADAEEIAIITQRLTRPTYSSLIHTEDSQSVHNYQFIREQSRKRRTPSACQKIPLSAHRKSTNDRRFTDWELQRVLRRLQKPTETSEHKRFFHDDDLRPAQAVTAVNRPKTGDEKTKFLERLVRPTTASRAKSVNGCHLCDEKSREKNKTLAPFEYVYANDTEFEQAVVEEIVERVRSSTHASTRGAKQCCRLTPARVDEVEIRKGLPLVSGLPRSNTVKEIVHRLHPPRFHGYRSATTPVSMS
ncbi:uncharacterized protein [Haliotis cracherodii]|uniref:uncharacterized protein n=1 Tax=Haliotis cracherodii TaxID=6455 RepID=UPI0039EB5E56